MSQVDKALKAFEYTTEWADLIAALGKLNRVLMAHMKYPIIPRRIVISKVRFFVLSKIDKLKTAWNVTFEF